MSWQIPSRKQTRHKHFQTPERLFPSPESAPRCHVDSHFGQRFRNGRQQLPHVRLEEPSDGADAEGVRLADLARINDETFFTEAAVEFIESELGIIRKMKRRDDVTLNFGIEINLKAKFLHASDEDLMVSLVARAARQDAALLVQFTQRLFKSQDRMGRRRVTKLAFE